MTVHDLHNGRGTILFDGCPRCEEHASHPFDSLDESHLGKLAVMAQDTSLAYETEASDNELIAIRRIQEIRHQFHRLLRAADKVREA